MADSGVLYYLNGLMLRVYPKSYLVEVRPVEDLNIEQHSIHDLPEWVLGSRRTIWLTLENASMMHRAQHGDAFRKALLHQVY